jgi:hypothetical protein
LSWIRLPRLATAIPGEASGALAERAGVTELPMPPLDVADARQIIERITARYHRVLEPEVIGALLAKRGAGGSAWNNPLWLALATEELNLVDAADFDRTHRYPGAPVEQLAALLCDKIRALPQDIPALYGATFDRAERLLGDEPTRAFLGLIAVSRDGLRETDFRALLPTLTGEPWDALRFAALRRLFRGQMRSRGPLAQWDFNHDQMRQAVLAAR